jgi:hypothetical protein
MTTNRRGFALLSALVAIIVISTLIAASARQTDEEGRAARAITLQHRALAGAEGVAWRTFVSTNAQTFRRAPIGASTHMTSITGELTQNLTVTKIDTAIVWIVANAHVQRGRESANHKVSLWAHLPSDTITTRLTPLSAGAWADLY